MWCALGLLKRHCTYNCKSFLRNFTNFFRITIQQNCFRWLLPKVSEIREHWCLHFSSFKKTLHWRIFYSYVSDKLSKKNIYLRKILGLDLKVFGLQIWIMLHFTGFGLEILWTGIYNCTFQILYWRWTWKYLDYLPIWITIIRFYWIWSWKYLDCDLRLHWFVY